MRPNSSEANPTIFSVATDSKLHRLSREECKGLEMHNLALSSAIDPARIVQSLRKSPGSMEEKQQRFHL
jgi:hypothetical protein